MEIINVKLNSKCNVQQFFKPNFELDDMGKHISVYKRSHIDILLTVTFVQVCILFVFYFIYVLSI